MSAGGPARWAPRSALLVWLATGCSLAHDGLGIDAPQPDVRDVTVTLEGGDGRPPTDASDAFDVATDAMDADADARSADADAMVDDEAAVADSSDVTSDVPIADTAPTTGLTGQRCDSSGACLAPTDGCIDLGSGGTVCAPCGGPGEPCCMDSACNAGSTPMMLGWNLQTICTCTQTVMGGDPGDACNFVGCGAGTQCTGAPGYCVRCGAIGQPCCAFFTCASASCSASPSGSELICR